MCNKKIYKRFENIYKYIVKNQDKKIGTHFFNTNLGKRKVEMYISTNNSFVLDYFDYDDSLLFCLIVDKNGHVNIVLSNIDEIAIFSAIYELECIIYEKKHKRNNILLEKMFSYCTPLQNSFLGFIWK